MEFAELAGGGTKYDGRSSQVQRRAMFTGKKHHTQESLCSTRAPSDRNALASLSSLGTRNPEKTLASQDQPASWPQPLRDTRLQAAEPEADELLEDVDEVDNFPFAEPCDKEPSASDHSAGLEQSSVNSVRFLQMLGSDSEGDDDNDCRGAFFSLMPAELNVDLYPGMEDISPDDFEGGSGFLAFEDFFGITSGELPKDSTIPGVKIRNISHDALPDLGKPGSQVAAHFGRVPNDRPHSAPIAATSQLLLPDQVSAAVFGNRVPTPPLPREKPGFQRAHRSIVKSPELHHASGLEQPACTSGSVTEAREAQYASTAGGVAVAQGASEDGSTMSSGIVGAPGQALLRWRRRS